MCQRTGSGPPPADAVAPAAAPSRLAARYSIRWGRFIFKLEAFHSFTSWKHPTVAPRSIQFLCKWHANFCQNKIRINRRMWNWNVWIVQSQYFEVFSALHSQLMNIHEILMSCFNFFKDSTSLSGFNRFVMKSGPLCLTSIDSSWRALSKIFWVRIYLTTLSAANTRNKMAREAVRSVSTTWRLSTWSDPFVTKRKSVEHIESYRLI